jgi:hypothetical protein
MFWVLNLVTLSVVEPATAGPPRLPFLRTCCWDRSCSVRSGRHTGTVGSRSPYLAGTLLPKLSTPSEYSVFDNGFTPQIALTK